ncbi:MAG: EamA family transporter [Verrucomicrobiales bacterium]
MEFLSGAIWLPFIGAVLHPFLSHAIQRSAKAGARPTDITCLSNLLSVSIFLLFLRPTGGWTLQGVDFLAIAAGAGFFLGQWFSVQSVKSGDIAVHSSAMGLKLILLAALSFLVGLEELSWPLLGGVILAVLAVYLVAGASLAGWKEHRNTVFLTLAACVFFGLTDFMTGWQSVQIGGQRWLVLMMASCGLLSLTLLLARSAALPGTLLRPAALRPALLAGLIFGSQALIVNIAFTRYQEPTLSNVVYSSRGLLAVLFLWWLHRKTNPRFRGSQLAGALLMMLSLALVLLA